MFLVSPNPSGLALAVPVKPVIEPQAFAQRFFQVVDEVTDDPARPVRLEELLQVEKLLDDKVGAELLRRVQYLLRHGTRLIGLVLGDEHHGQEQLSERTA